MKIVMINGSHRNKGVTAGVLQLIEEKLSLMYPIKKAEKQLEIRIFHLSDYQPAYCSGCTTCYKEGYCPLDKKDRFDEVRKAIHDADGVILGSPNYVSSVSGLFKTFLDRIDIVTGQVMHKKTVMVVSTYQNIRGNKINAYITEQVRLGGGRVRGRLNLKMDPYLKPYPYSHYFKGIQRECQKFMNALTQQPSQNTIEKVYTFAVKRALKDFMKDEEHYGALIKEWHAKGIV